MLEERKIQQVQSNKILDAKSYSQASFAFDSGISFLLARLDRKGAQIFIHSDSSQFLMIDLFRLCISG